MSIPPVGTLPGIPEHRVDAPDSDLPPLGEIHEKEPHTWEAEPADKPKRKYTRRLRGGEPAPEASAPDSAPGATPEEMGALKQAIAMSTDFFGRYMAAKRGQHWLVPAEESDLLGEAWANALAPYMATFAKATPMILAVVVTAGVFGPRLQQDAILAEAEAAKASQRPRRKESDNGKAD